MNQQYTKLWPLALSLMLLFSGCGSKIRDPGGNSLPAVGSEAVVSSGVNPDTWMLQDLPALRYLMKNDRPKEELRALALSNPDGFRDVIQQDMKSKYKKIGEDGRATFLDEGIKVKIVEYYGTFDRGELTPVGEKNEAAFCKVEVTSGQFSGKTGILYTTCIKQPR